MKKVIMRVYLLGLFFLLFGGDVIAQEVRFKLTLTDASTGQVLPFVPVQLTPGNHQGYTDEAGKIEFIVLPGRYRLRASFTGFEDFEEAVDLREDAEGTLGMTPAAETLTTVVVTDQDARSQLDRAVMGVERLSARALESIPAILGERDVLKSLQLLPGVTSAGEASNGISVRGGTIDQNLLLLDGAPVFTPTHLFGLFTIFTPDAVGGVDLYRGNVPARFGGRAAAVVDVQSKTPNREATEIKGGIGLVASHLSIDTPLDRSGKLSVLAAVRGGLNDFAFAAIRRLRGTKSRFGDALLKLRYQPSERDILTLSGFWAGDFYQVDLLSQFAGVPATANQYAYLTANGSLAWNRSLNDQLNLEARLTQARFRPELRFPQLDNSLIIFGSGIDQTGGELGLRLRSGEEGRLYVGVDAKRYVLRPGRLDPGPNVSVAPVDLVRENGEELALVADYEGAVGKRLRFSAGLRYNRYRQIGPVELRNYVVGAELIGSNLESVTPVAAGNTAATYAGLAPRLGLSYRLSTTTSLKASYARTYQYLQNIYNATSPLPTSRWKVADNNVGPQRADLVAAGISWLAASGAFSLRAEGYYRQLTDLLEYKPGADFFLTAAVETDLLRGQGRAYGLELTAERRLGRLTGVLNYAYGRTENRVSGPTPRTRINRGAWYPGYFDQPHTFAANLTLDEGRTHELGFNLVVQSNRPYTIPNGFVEVNEVAVPLFLERNNARLPLYHRLDFSWTIHNIKRRKKAWTGDWVFTVYNVYGRNNAYNIFYQPRDANTPQLGIFSRSPFASYRLSIFGAPVLSLAYKFTFLPRLRVGSRE